MQSPIREEWSAALLRWYDRHARVMPWRMGPEERASGSLPEVYPVWLSEVMLQQTTVAAVKSYWRKFVETWPTVVDLANAEDEEVMAAWAGLGYYARARNLLKCARVVRDTHGGVFPKSAAELIKLPGIGAYSSASIAAICFDEPAVVVDGNVERVVSRLFRVEEALPKAKREITALAGDLTPDLRAGDYAQAVMDLGATICTPRGPVCALCPLKGYCAAFEAGDAESYPRKAPKKVKPTRYGHVYLAHSGEGWHTVTRPASGLLGGMLAFPSSEWGEAPDAAAPFAADWREIGEVKHTFTHFHLILTVHLAGVRAQQTLALDPEALPTVFRKAYDLADAHLALKED